MRTKLLCFIGALIISAFSMSGCGGGGGGGLVAVAPTAPAALIANAGDGQVTLEWTPVSGATNYNLYEGTAPGVTKTTGTKHASVSSPYTRNGCTNGTTYYYVVTAVNAAGESGISVEISATPTATPSPMAPGNVRAVAGDAQVTVSWDPVPGATSYNVYRGTAPGVTIATGAKVTGAVSPQAVAGLVNGTKYYFVVTAVNANGESVESFEVSATPSANPPPAAPTGVGAVAGNAKVTISWSAVTGAYSYNIYYATSSGVTKATGTLVRGQWGDVSPQDVTGLVNGTKYYFVVTAVHWIGGSFIESAESAEVSATPTAPPSNTFSQADLTGVWNLIHFYSGPSTTAGNDAAWLVINATVNAAGAVTVNSIITNSGPGEPPAGTITWTINPTTGVVTEGGTAGGFLGNHMVMSTNKQLVVGTASDLNDRLLRVAVKQYTGSFLPTDIASQALVYNQLDSGTSNIWSYGTGSINAQRVQYFSTQVNPSGPVGGFLEPQILAVDANGLVSSSSLYGPNPSYHGIMTPDKKTLFYVDSIGTIFRFGVVAFTGQTFTQGDLAGTWYAHGLASSSTVPDWEHATLTLDSSGAGTVSDLVDASTGPTPGTAPIATTLTSSGAFGIPGEPDVNGFMSYNKDILVFTTTWTPGIQYGLYVTVK